MSEQNQQRVYDTFLLFSFNIGIRVCGVPRTGAKDN